MGEGQEAYDEAVKAEDASIYLDKMAEREDKDAVSRAKEVSFNRSDVSEDDILEARNFHRKQAENQAWRENTVYDERVADSVRSAELTEDETKAVLYFSQNRAEDEGREPNAEDVLDAYRTLDTAKRHRAKPEDIKHWGTYDEFLASVAEKQRQREMISPEVKTAIVQAAKDRFEKYFEGQISVGTKDSSGKDLNNLYEFIVALQAEKSGTHEYGRIQGAYQELLDALLNDVLSDEAVGKLVGDNSGLQAATREWAYKYYGKELDSFIQKKLGADNYSI